MCFPDNVSVRINMAIATVKITDKNFRITIPEDVRAAEKIKVGDIIQIDVNRVYNRHRLDGGGK